MSELPVSEPLPLDESAPRYAPSRSFPSHRYLPGFNARPDENEHLDATALVPPERLHETELFRHGVDLFNHAYFWEAHEAWETLWQKCPEGPIRQGLQGLIQLAAANLKEALRVPSGAVRLAETACHRLETARSGGALGCLDLEDLTRRATAHFAALKEDREPNVPSPGIRMDESRGGN